MGQGHINLVNKDQYKDELAREISQLLSPYLDDQILSAVFEARRSGIKDIVVYLDTINHQIFQLERDEVTKDPGAPEGLRNMLSTASADAAPFGVEVPGYLSFWFVVALPDSRLAAMAVSAVPNNNSGLN